MAAIEMPLRHRPAVVLIDVRLGSGINGVKAAQGICQERLCRIIFLTGANKTATRLRIDASAPADVLIKPILPQHLIGALRSLPGSTDSERYQGEQFPNDVYQAFEDLRCDSR